MKKGFLTKAFVAVGVMASAAAMSSMAVFAYDYDYTIATPAAKTVDNYTDTTSGNVVLSVNHNKDGDANKGAKFDDVSSKTVSSELVTSAGTPYYIGVVAQAGDTITLVKGTNNEIVDDDWKVVKVSGTNAVASGKVSEATAYASFQNGSVTLNDEATYKIYNVSGSSKYVKGVKSVSGVAQTMYTVSGSISGGTAALANKKFSLGNYTATIDANGTGFSATVPDGTYAVSSNLSLYTITADSDIVVNGADIVNATVKATAKPTYNVTGSITGTTLTAGDEFTLTNEAYSDVAVTATVAEGGSTFTANGLIAGSYKVTGVNAGENYNLSNDTVTVGNDGSITGLTFAYASKMTKSFTKVFTTSASAGQDLGNGVYAIGDLTAADDSYSINGKCFTQYITNTKDNATASNYIPTAGTAMKYVAGVNGTLTLYTVANSNKTYYITSKGASDTTGTKVKEVTTGATKTIYADTFAVTAGTEYYIYATGTKLAFVGCDFVATGDSALVNNAESTANASAFCNPNNDKVYAVAVVTATQVADTTKTAVNIKYNDTTVATTDKVYSKVNFDDSNVYDATAFGGDSGDFLYVAELNNDTSSTDAQMITAVNGLTVSVEQ